MKILSAQNIPFKGTIKITNQKDKTSTETTYYHTTKKQDGEILFALSNTLKKIGSNPRITSNDTLELSKAIENVTSKKTNLSKTGGEKHIFVGNPSIIDKYDTSYNKVYYNSSIWDFPMNKVTIDFMEPNERFEAAQKLLEEIQQKFSQISDTVFAAGLNPEILKQSNFQPERYAELEEILSRTLQFLEDDTQSVGYIKTVADENTVKETYKEFLKNLYLACGIEIPEQLPEIQNDGLEFLYKNYEKIKRTAQYLKIQTEKQNLENIIS